MHNHSHNLIAKTPGKHQLNLHFKLMNITSHKLVQKSN